MHDSKVVGNVCMYGLTSVITESEKLQVDIRSAPCNVNRKLNGSVNISIAIAGEKDVLIDILLIVLWAIRISLLTFLDLHLLSFQCSRIVIITSYKC